MHCRADTLRSNPTRAILNYFFLKNWRDLDFYEQKFQETEKFHVRKVKCLVRATERKISVWQMETSDDPDRRSPNWPNQTAVIFPVARAGYCEEQIRWVPLSISEAAKSNDRIASRENNAFVPLSPGKIDLDIELKTKAVHQTKIKHTIFNTMFQLDESEVLFTFVQFDLHLVKKDRGEVLE